MHILESDNKKKVFISISIVLVVALCCLNHLNHLKNQLK